jgi:hypothetical protein
MGPPDDDIQFDFFDEPATVEASQAPRMRLPQRGGRGPRRGPGSPLQPGPLGRLTALVFFVGVIVFIFVFVIESCAAQSRHSVYSSYMDKVTTIAQQSTNDGKKTVATLTSSGLSVTKIVNQLHGIADAEQQNVDAAQGIVPPGRLQDEHRNLIEALELRVSGVAGLAKAFEGLSSSKASNATEATALAQQAYRLLASDVVWADLFQKPAEQQLVDDGVRDVAPPASVFVVSPDLVVTQKAMLYILQRLLGQTSSPTDCTQSTGLHGTNLVSVSALPNGSNGTAETLTPGTLNTVTTGTSLQFRVTINDGGDYQEVNIPIELVVQRTSSEGGPISRKAKVQVINPGSQASVLFGNLEGVPFGSQTKVTVDVGKVPCESNTSNNSGSYNVIFSLPS